MRVHMKYNYILILLFFFIYVGIANSEFSYQYSPDNRVSDNFSNKIDNINYSEEISAKTNNFLDNEPVDMKKQDTLDSKTSLNDRTSEKKPGFFEKLFKIFGKKSKQKDINEDSSGILEKHTYQSFEKSDTSESPYFGEVSNLDASIKLPSDFKGLYEEEGSEYNEIEASEAKQLDSNNYSNLHQFEESLYSPISPPGETINENKDKLFIDKSNLPKYDQFEVEENFNKITQKSDIPQALKIDPTLHKTFNFELEHNDDVIHETKSKVGDLKKSEELKRQKHFEPSEILKKFGDNLIYEVSYKPVKTNYEDYSTDRSLDNLEELDDHKVQDKDKNIALRELSDEASNGEMDISTISNHENEIKYKDESNLEGISTFISKLENEDELKYEDKSKNQDESIEGFLRGFEEKIGTNLDEYETARAEDLDEYETARAEDLDEYKTAPAEDLDEYEIARAEDLDEYEIARAEDLDEYEIARAEDLDEYEIARAEDLDEYEIARAEDLDEYEIARAEDLDELEKSEELDKSQDNENIDKLLFYEQPELENSDETIQEGSNKAELHLNDDIYSITPSEEKKIEEASTSPKYTGTKESSDIQHKLADSSFTLNSDDKYDEIVGENAIFENSSIDPLIYKESSYPYILTKETSPEDQINVENSQHKRAFKLIKEIADNMKLPREAYEAQISETHGANLKNKISESSLLDRNQIINIDNEVKKEIDESNPIKLTFLDPNSDISSEISYDEPSLSIPIKNYNDQNEEIQQAEYSKEIPSMFGLSSSQQEGTSLVEYIETPEIYKPSPTLTPMSPIEMVSHELPKLQNYENQILSSQAQDQVERILPTDNLENDYSQKSPSSFESVEPVPLQIPELVVKPIPKSVTRKPIIRSKGLVRDLVEKFEKKELLPVQQKLTHVPKRKIIKKKKENVLKPLENEFEPGIDMFQVRPIDDLIEIFEVESPNIVSSTLKYDLHDKSNANIQNQKQELTQQYIETELEKLYSNDSPSEKEESYSLKSPLSVESPVQKYQSQEFSNRALDTQKTLTSKGSFSENSPLDEIVKKQYMNNEGINIDSTLFIPKNLKSIKRVAGGLRWASHLGEFICSLKHLFHCHKIVDDGLFNLFYSPKRSDFYAFLDKNTDESIIDEILALSVKEIEHFYSIVRSTISK
ncbi:hypothetical protein ACR3K2_30680 [Cryptosporidium serpentis]